MPGNDKEIELNNIASATVQKTTIADNKNLNSPSAVKENSGGRAAVAAAVHANPKHGYQPIKKLNILVARVLFMSIRKPPTTDCELPTDKTNSAGTKAIVISDTKVVPEKDNKSVSWGWLSVHKFFLPVDVTRIQSVCRDWKQVGISNQFWQPFLKKDIAAIFRNESFYDVFKNSFECRLPEYLAQPGFVRGRQFYVQAALLSALEPYRKDIIYDGVLKKLADLCKNKIFLEAIFRQPTLLKNLQRVCNVEVLCLVEDNNEPREAGNFVYYFFGKLSTLFSSRKILNSLDLLTVHNLAAIFVTIHVGDGGHIYCGLGDSYISKLFHHPVSNLGYRLLSINIQKGRDYLFEAYSEIVSELGYPYVTPPNINDDTIIDVCELEFDKLNVNSPTEVKDRREAIKVAINKLTKMFPSKKCSVM